MMLEVNGILCAGLFGSLVGLERELHGQPAGLRTHMILAVGAALAAILSISYSQFLSNPEMMSDPGRIVAQVVSGVGFLGAGAILRFGVTIKGLTTASSLWTTAIIGIAAGSGEGEARGRRALRFLQHSRASLAREARGRSR